MRQTWSTPPWRIECSETYPALRSARCSAHAEEVAAAGIRPPLARPVLLVQPSEGADSIRHLRGLRGPRRILGDEPIDTGHGGQDARGAQVADQALDKAKPRSGPEAPTTVSPVRVARGAGGGTLAHSATHRDTATTASDHVDSYCKDTGHPRFRHLAIPAAFAPRAQTRHQPQAGGPPLRRDDRRAFATVQRLVRNTAVTQWVKALYGFRCQVCGGRLETPVGPYAEGAHLRPVGQPHHGPDEASNVLCLCPNDHVKLDRGAHRPRRARQRRRTLGRHSNRLS